MSVYSLNAFKNASAFIQDAPKIISTLDKAYKTLFVYSKFPPIYKVCKELILAKSLMEYNLQIAEKAVKLKGKYEE